MSGSANVQVESANVRLAEISKCLSQQMSKPSQLKSRQQKSVSKSPVGKCQIGKIPHTKIIRIINELPCAKAPSVDKNKNYTANPPQQIFQARRQITFVFYEMLPYLNLTSSCQASFVVHLESGHCRAEVERRSSQRTTEDHG